MASYPANGDDDDDFPEFNPHPYLGGVDLAAVYGPPLPPSLSICYSISSSSFEISAPSVPSASRPPSPPLPSHVAEPEKYPPYDYGNRDHVPYDVPDAFRSLPWGAFPVYGADPVSSGFDYWNHMMRGLDYLFGHADGYGERRIGQDSHGIPVYAEKKSCSTSLVFQIEPPISETLAVEQRVDGCFYQQPENWSLTSGQLDHKQCASVQQLYYPFGRNSQEHLTATSSDTSFWSLPASFEPTEATNGDRYGTLSPFDEELLKMDFFSGPIYSYQRHFSESALHVQGNPTEVAWSEDALTYENSESYSNRGDIFDRESFEEAHGYQLEPYSPSWYQYSGNYPGSLEDTSLHSNHHTSPHHELGIVEQFCSSSEKLNQEESHGSELQDNKPSWYDHSNEYIYGEDAFQRSTHVDDSCCIS